MNKHNHILGSPVCVCNPQLISSSSNLSWDNQAHVYNHLIDIYPKTNQLINQQKHPVTIFYFSFNLEKWEWRSLSPWNSPQIKNISHWPLFLLLQYTILSTLFFWTFSFIFSFLNIYLFGCTGSSLQHLETSIFVMACRIFSCSIWTLSCSRWDLVPWPGINPGPPALGMWSFSLRTIREVPLSPFLPVFFFFHRSPSAILHKPVSLLQFSYLSSCSEQASKLTNLIEIIHLYKMSQRHSVVNFSTSSVLLLYTSPPLLISPLESSSQNPLLQIHVLFWEYTMLCCTSMLFFLLWVGFPGPISLTSFN